RYFGGTFLPFKTLPPPRSTLAPPTTAILSNCFSSSARRSKSIWSTRFRKSISASTVIPDRLTFGMVISGGKTVEFGGFRGVKQFCLRRWAPGSAMSDIFISYAKADHALALRLAAFLEAEGWTVWLDKSLAAADLYQDEIMKQLTAARAVITIWTENSIKSDW